MAQNLLEFKLNVTAKYVRKNLNIFLVALIKQNIVLALVIMKLNEIKAKLNILVNIVLRNLWVMPVIIEYIAPKLA